MKTFTCIFLVSCAYLVKNAQGQSPGPFLLSCDVGVPNIRYLTIPGVQGGNSSTKSVRRNLTDAYDVYLDGRSIEAPSRTPWKIQSEVAHTLETKNGPFYDTYNALITTSFEIYREIAPCFPKKTPDNIPFNLFFEDDDPYTILRTYYFSAWEYIYSCPFEKNFTTDGYYRNSFVDTDDGAPTNLGENTTCTLFQTDEETEVKIDLTIIIDDKYIINLEDDFFYNFTYAYGQIVLESVEKCKGLGGRCKNSDKCCLGYACIREKENDKRGACAQCKVLGETCLDEDACCDGLKCSNKGKCKAL